MVDPQIFKEWGQGAIGSLSTPSQANFIIANAHNELYAFYTEKTTH